MQVKLFPRRISFRYWSSECEASGLGWLSYRCKGRQENSLGHNVWIPNSLPISVIEENKKILESAVEALNRLDIDEASELFPLQIAPCRSQNETKGSQEPSQINPWRFTLGRTIYLPTYMHVIDFTAVRVYRSPEAALPRVPLNELILTCSYILRYTHPLYYLPTLQISCICIYNPHLCVHITLVRRTQYAILSSHDHFPTHSDPSWQASDSVVILFYIAFIPLVLWCEYTCLAMCY